jgi:Xaa-Pro aminopeptidase
MLEPKIRISPKELERRHELLRTKMEEQGLDILLVSGFRFVGSIGYLRYLTNWAEPFAGESLAFPRKGIPIFFARTAERAHLVENLLGLKTVTGSTGVVVAHVLEKMETRRIGICGLKTMSADFYIQLIKQLPNMEFDEESGFLDELRMVKSEEELGWVKQSAHLGDMAFQVFSGLIGEGRLESDIFVEVEHMVKRFGAENTYFMMAADPKPVPKFIDMAYDSYQKGDLILFNAEIAGPGGYFTQIVRTLSLGSPSGEAQEAFATCVEALRSGEALLKPGQRTVEVYKTIRSTIENAGYKMGLHPGHSQGLDIFERPMIDGKDDVELKEGMVIVLHPHVLMPSGGGIWMGETFVITSEAHHRCFRSSLDFSVIE